MCMLLSCAARFELWVEKKTSLRLSCYEEKCKITVKVILDVWCVASE